MQHTMTRRIATVREAAEHYGVSIKTVRRWIADGRIPAHRMGPRLIRVDLNEIDPVLMPGTV